ncbi:hypothetical protein [Micromonospora sp. URMC 103]|uniref:hypothetical protein n=1 Tax=Micromonospora sp. URMC 103 TaxID=3423406 RepID=UPI003F1C4981
MTTLTVRKRGGTFVLDGAGGASARLRTGWTWRRGEIDTGGGVWHVEPTDPRIGVAARASHGAAVLLDPRRSELPGPGGEVRWRPGRHHGELVRDGKRLTVRLSARPRGPIRVDVTGSWADLELVALTACFALMTRRRRRTIMAMTVAGAIGNGSSG